MKKIFILSLFLISCSDFTFSFYQGEVFYPNSSKVNYVVPSPYGDCTTDEQCMAIKEYYLCYKELSYVGRCIDASTK